MNRISLVLTASAAALLATTAGGAAHNAAAVPGCTEALITGALFAPGSNRVQVVVATETAEVLSTSVEISNGTPARVDYVLSPGTHRVTVWLAWDLPDHHRALHAAGSAEVTCPAPAPAPAPVEVSPAPVPATVPPPGETPVKVTAPGRRADQPVKRPPRPRYLCPAPLPSKAWQRIILRRHGVRCPVRRPRPPVHVAVAGERVGGTR